MTREQAQIIIDLITVEAAIASHKQNPPRDWFVECAELRARLLDSTEESE